MKVVKLVKVFGDYGWKINRSNNESVSCKCIMAIALNKQIYSLDLIKMEYEKTLSLKEYKAIRRLDGFEGTKEDVKTIRGIAKRYGVKVKVIS